MYSLAGKGTGEGGKDGEGSEGTKASEEPSSRSAGFQFHFFWPLLLLSLITLKWINVITANFILQISYVYKYIMIIMINEGSKTQVRLCEHTWLAVMRLRSVDRRTSQRFSWALFLLTETTFHCWTRGVACSRWLYHNYEFCIHWFWRWSSPAVVQVRPWLCTYVPSWVRGESSYAKCYNVQRPRWYGYIALLKLVIIMFHITIFLYTVAALNQGTCDALDSIDDNSTTLTCTTNSVCNKTTCTSSGALQGLTLFLELLPCMDLPGYNTCTLARCALETWTWW